MLIPVQGHSWPEPIPEAQGERRETALDRMLFCHRATHTDTHSDWDSVDTSVYLICTSLEYGRKPKSPEKTHADLGRTCELHTVNGPNWETVFSHQC